MKPETKLTNDLNLPPGLRKLFLAELKRAEKLPFLEALQTIQAVDRKYRKLQVKPRS